MRDGFDPVADGPRNQIQMHMHCAKCMQELPPGESPRTFARRDVGLTVEGLQVFCTRHGTSIVHIDFEGLSHPAALDDDGLLNDPGAPRPRTSLGGMRAAMGVALDALLAARTNVLGHPEPEDGDPETAFDDAIAALRGAGAPAA